MPDNKEYQQIIASDNLIISYGSVPKDSADVSVPDYVDKGWAWMIAFAAGIANLVSFGALKSSGIFLNEINARFNAPALTTSVIIFLTVGTTIIVSEYTNCIFSFYYGNV